MSILFETEEQVDILENIDIDSPSALVVFNDDVNTFEHVIDALIEIWNHTTEQAEQCTLIVHYKGKCSVKKGTFKDMVPMRNALCDKGISAEVLEQ